MIKRRYIRLRGQHVHDYVQKSIIRIEHCSSEDNLADLLTKPLNAVKLKSLRQRTGMFHPEDSTKVNFSAVLKENKNSLENQVFLPKNQHDTDQQQFENDLLLESTIFFFNRT